MKCESMSLPTTNPLLRDYVARVDEAASFFEYRLDQRDASLPLKERLAWLRGRNYPHREALADGLRTYNEEIGNHLVALANVEKLRDQDTYVVVAGQQAGLLTGPLYTIHKAVDLVRTAKRMTQELGVTVVPIFWIAGEDHDFDEVNHVYYPSETDGETRLSKRTLTASAKGRFSVSMQEFGQDEWARVIEQFFHEQQETSYSSELRDLLYTTAEGATTLVEWFAKLMAQLFGKHGLVFLESSALFVRELERPVFRQVIERNEEIMGHLQAAEQRLQQAGYPTQLQLDPKQANLFFYEEGERFLLERGEQERFVLKHRGKSYSRKELLALLERDPSRFSANVVTRPLAQEHLLPTLAFIGGPGELAYWAYFKAYFAAFGYQLPVLLPRTSVTLVEGALERIMEQLGLERKTVLSGADSYAAWKRDWLAGLDDVGLMRRFDETEAGIVQIYQGLVGDVVAYDAGLRELAANNRDRLMEQVAFLRERTERSIHQRHEVAIRRVERIEGHLRPLGQLQERVLNVFPYLNRMGLDLIDRLVDAPYTSDGTHQVLSVVDNA